MSIAWLESFIQTQILAELMTSGTYVRIGMFSFLILFWDIINKTWLSASVSACHLVFTHKLCSAASS